MYRCARIRAYACGREKGGSSRYHPCMCYGFAAFGTSGFRIGIFVTSRTRSSFACVACFDQFVIFVFLLLMLYRGCRSCCYSSCVGEFMYVPHPGGFVFRNVVRSTRFPVRIRWKSFVRKMQRDTNGADICAVWNKKKEKEVNGWIVTFCFFRSHGCPWTAWGRTIEMRNTKRTP